MNALEADLLPTGSISFGRFETEILSWEIRSPFSHNRYLEEVEKCSTPGSVTQKKAYFEAHFKKKGRLPYASIDDQNEFESQIPDDGIEDHMNYTEHYLDHGNKEKTQFVWQDKSIDIPDEDEKAILEDGQEHTQFSLFDERPALSNDSEHNVIEKANQQVRFNWCDEASIVSNELELSMKEHEQEEISSPKHSLDAAPCKMEKTSDLSAKLVEQNEQAQVQCTHDSIAADKDVCCETMQQEPGSGSGALEKLEKKEMPCKGLTLEKSTSSALRKAPTISPRLSLEQNLSKSKPRTSRLVAWSPRMTSIGKDSPSSPASVTRRMNRTANEKMKSEKQLHMKVPSQGIAESRNLESEQRFGNLKVRVRQEANSEKVQVPRRSGVIAKSIYERHDADLQPSTSRSQMSISSNKINIRKSNRVLNFRCDERAGKRKEDIVPQRKSMNPQSNSTSPRCKLLKPRKTSHVSPPLRKQTSSTQKNYPMSPTSNFSSPKLKVTSCECKGTDIASGPSNKIDLVRNEGSSQATAPQRQHGDSETRKLERMGSAKRPGIRKMFKM